MLDSNVCESHFRVPKNYFNSNLELQKIVPSLSISIGGPPVSGRLILAISLPPFQVAPSSTWASVS